MSNACDITLNDSEIERLDTKLRAERSNLDADEASIIEAVLKRARSARKIAKTADAGWYFSWTYRF